MAGAPARLKPAPTPAPARAGGAAAAGNAGGAAGRSGSLPPASGPGGPWHRPGRDGGQGTAGDSRDQLRCEAVLQLEQLGERSLDPGAARHVAGRNLDEPAADDDAPAELRMAAGDHPACPEAAADLLDAGHRDRGLAAGQRRADLLPRQHVQARGEAAPEVVDQGRRDAVANPVVARIAAEVGERQHGDGAARGGRLRGCGGGLLGSRRSGCQQGDQRERPAPVRCHDPAAIRYRAGPCCARCSDAPMPPRL